MRMLLPCGILLPFLYFTANLQLCKAYGEHLDPAEKQRRSDEARKVVDDLNGNRIGNGKWQAAYNEHFAVMNETERRRMHGFINVPFPGSSDVQVSGATGPPTNSTDSTSTSSSEETKTTKPNWTENL